VSAVDTSSLKAATDIVSVIGQYVELRKEGHEYKGLCPFHGDKNPSMSVVPRKGFFFCHSCGASGDVISFVRQMENCSFKEAVEKLGGAPDPARAPIAYPKLTPVPSPERKAYAPPEEHTAAPDMKIPPNANPAHPWKLTKTWTYYGTRREVLFYVGRYEWYDGDGELWKTYRAFTYSDDGWKCKHWHEPRPLYNLHNLVQSPDLPVALFEGEKSADAGAILGGARWVASTWPGGAPNASKGDYSHLQGRKVIIWPDADPAGERATEDLLERLHGVASEVWVFTVSDMPDGWDVADAVEDDGWDAARLDSWTRETVAGHARLRRHAYGDEPPARAGLAPADEEPEPEPIRARQRKHSDIAATARHWSMASWRDKLIVVAGKNKDVAIRCIENATVPLEYADEWAGLLAWDELRQCITATRPTPWGEQPEEWSDHHDTALECWYDRTGLHYKGLVSEAVNLVAHRNSFHPVRDYLNSLKWDRKPRADLWLTTYCGAEDDDLIRFFASRWLVSAVARAIKPGEQVKTCLILFGEQDAGKSSALKALGAPWYTIQHGNIGGDSTKSIEQCSKAWIIEMAELAKIKRTDDVESIKAFLATDEDTYRPAYARRVQTIKRCCVFAGTSNPNEVFSDTTGNVRFWPVTTRGEVDVAGLRRDRDQIWAEAVARYRKGERWWIEDGKLRKMARDATEEHRVKDVWEDEIYDWLTRPENATRKYFRSSEIASDALKLTMRDLTKSEQFRISNCMRLAGFDYADCPFEFAQGVVKRMKGWRRVE
jgi:predicted P-loop ATPase